MAGIGFELRKIVSKKTLLRSTACVLYSIFTTIGSTLVFILLLILVRLAMNYFGTTEVDKLYFTGTFTNVFLFACVLTGTLNVAVSRYVADRIFMSKEREIAASIFGVMVLSLTIAAVFGAIICCLLYFRENRPLFEVCCIYIFNMLAVSTYNMVTYVAALKQYKHITLTYIIGLLLVLGLFVLLMYFDVMSMMEAVFLSLDIGFAFINIRLLHISLKSFGMPQGNMFAFFDVLKRYPGMVLSGFFYAVMVYGSNAIYWHFSELSVHTACFYIAPVYDLAMFLAIVVNLTGLVLFEIKAETAFYEKFVSYLSVLDRGSLTQIRTANKKLQKNLNMQVFFVYEIQLIITVIAICLLYILHPYIGISEQTMNMVLILSMGIYCVTNMYCNVIMLYYFEDYLGACISTASSSIIMVVGCFICCRLGDPFYPIPVLIGGLCGWIVSFIILRRKTAGLTEHLMCK